MKKWISKFIPALIVAVFAGSLLTYRAWADYSATQGSGSTVFSFVCFTTKICPAHVLTNSAGTEIMTTTTPGTVQGASASGAALAGNPLRVGMSDGTNAQNWLAAIALADGVNGNNTGAMAQWYWNGTTYDRAKGDATNGAFVNVKAAVGVVAQASTTSGQSGNLVQCAVTTSAPTYTTAQTDPLSCDTSGNVRVNVTNANNNGRATSGNSSPVVQPSAPSTWHLIAAATTNATSVKGSAAVVFSCQLSGVGSTPAFLKIYNKATAPTVGTDTPVKTLIIPAAATAANGAGSNISFGPGGLALGTGFAAAVTGVITDADTTAVAASTFAINCDYE